MHRNNNIYGFRIELTNRLLAKFNSIVIYKTLSTFRWRFNKNVTCSISYENEDNLLEWGGCSIHLPLGHCASLIHATRKFF